MNETSQPVELHVDVRRGAGKSLGAQIEDEVRGAIRAGALAPGTELPSTRDLARQLGVSRRITVDAYAQLAAEGYLTVRQGARPRVSETSTAVPASDPPARPPSPRPRFDMRPSLPDVSSFPWAAWLRSWRSAIQSIPVAELGYADPRGAEVLRGALAAYLGRVRGVLAHPERVVITSGYSQGLGMVCRVLAAGGAERIAFEDPSHHEHRLIAGRSGLRVVPIEVDEDGIRVDQLTRAGVDAVVLTPAHQHPMGVTLSGARRGAIIEWLRANDALVIEDDYDAEYRYDRAAIGSLQALEPERVVYAGSTSKTLAPALPVGWLVVPQRLVEPLAAERTLADQATARIEQRAFAEFVERGHLDRHLRRMRHTYRARRDLLVEALGTAVPSARAQGIAAGLHVAVELPDRISEDEVQAEASRRGIAIDVLARYRVRPSTGPPTILLGYGQLPAASIPAATEALADAIGACET
jgi:GntR family transcriptional regulator / MocR family aminotransferase